ncbi:MAG: PQQ-dependent sugar dehydrogenase, partial [Alphaproteobacteria bacterium]
IVKGTQGYAVESVAKIDRPWGMAFLPNGHMLISFRNDGMRTVDQKGVVSEPIANVPQMVMPRLGSGMYGVIADKDFAKNRTIYFAYHTRMAGDAAAMGRVSSARLSADEKSLSDVKVLREGVDIQPRAIVQGKDGKLYAFSGDVTDTGQNTQNMMSQLGKVLRINTDGTVPADNPFVGRADVNPAVWANGYRDIHSAVVHPRTGEVWAAENVPEGGDEIDIFRKGKNYGFGVISYGRQNNGAYINGGKTAQDGMEQPLYYWNPSIAPSGMMFYTGNKFPGWKNNLFVGGMSGMQVTRLVMDGEKVVGEEKLLMDRCERIKVIDQGPDGNIYILTDQMPGYDNEILRLVPARTPPEPKQPVPGAPIPAAQPGPGAPARSGGAAAPAAAGAPGRGPAAPAPAPAPSAAAAPAVTLTPAELAAGQAAFARVCAGCHGPAGAGAYGPPIAGRTDVAFISQVIVNGAGAMPPFGSDSISNADRDAVAKFVGTLKRGG